ncbi:MAG: Asp-tRNA(Asn)/Glu-tRNA(Gln) amidotransferase subunit GatB [Chloroflexaceae bacterium]|nr:Asp-tRNA(Asn)/Glu-tRNA(Gln) amidotransferase subunit GatB [Chloroflexaceae bacterium]
MSDYLTTIGLEVHAQVRTASKMFDACSTDYAGGAPNQCISVVSLGLPGALPVINQRAIELAALTGLAINCTVQLHSVFARKSYIYPDLPKGYQISQYDQPICTDGWITIEGDDGQPRRIGIERLHIEEDTGRLVHYPDGTSLIDYNRSGMPLMEIVSKPDIASPEEAKRYFQKLRQILMWIGVNSGNMEEGALRCDANVSVRPASQQAFGTKVEIKNMNSFRAVERALVYEVERQIDVLESGGSITQETRGWNEAQGITVGQRSKEFAHDYRYFAEPDLPPLIFEPAWVEARQAELPELPDVRCARFIADYALSQQDADLLTTDRAVADYFETAVDAARAIQGTPKDVANWILGEGFRLLNDSNEESTNLGTRMPVAHLINVMDLLAQGKITRTVAKQVFEASFQNGQPPDQIVAEQGLTQISDTDALATLAREVIANNPKAVDEYRRGKKTAIQFLVGQIMKATRGQANPQTARTVLEAELDTDA